jgi:hypothetical protein
MTRRALRLGSVVVALFILTNLVAPISSSASGNGWSISLSGALEGTARKIKSQCVVSSEDAPLLGRTTFRIEGRRLVLTMLFDGPTAPGTRTFSQTPEPTTVVVSLSDADDPAAVWTSTGAGSGTIESDGRAGTLQGTLVGAEGEVELDASFVCTKARTGRSNGQTDSDEGDERPDLAPNFTGTVEATTSVNCTGTETGEVVLWGFEKRRVFGGLLVSGSYTCQGVTVPTEGTVVLNGSFKNNTLRLHVQEILGLLLAPPVCLVGVRLSIPVRNGSGSFEREFTAPSGDVYDCTITVERG